MANFACYYKAMLNSHDPALFRKFQASPGLKTIVRPIETDLLPEFICQVATGQKQSFTLDSKMGVCVLWDFLNQQEKNHEN